MESHSLSQSPLLTNCVYQKQHTSTSSSSSSNVVYVAACSILYHRQYSSDAVTCVFNMTWSTMAFMYKNQACSDQPLWFKQIDLEPGFISSQSLSGHLR